MGGVKSITRFDPDGSLKADMTRFADFLRLDYLIAATEIAAGIWFDKFANWLQTRITMEC